MTVPPGSQVPLAAEPKVEKENTEAPRRQPANGGFPRSRPGSLGNEAVHPRTAPCPPSACPACSPSASVPWLHSLTSLGPGTSHTPTTEHRLSLCSRTPAHPSSVTAPQACLTLQPRGLQPARPLCAWSSPGKSAGVGCHALLQGVFPTQGWNPGLLHCRQSLGPLSHQGREPSVKI